jgi:dTDP-4-dehydrorhamnose reductase
MVINEKRKVFGIGITGLIGTRIAEILADSYEFQNLSLETGIDITDPSTLSLLEGDTAHEIVLHLAAKADVDGCENDKQLGKDGAAWRINVDGTRNVADACKKQNKKLVYISTDFVFDGTKPNGETYSEEDTPNPVNWYAQTKYEGEKIVRESGLTYLILRLAYPYRTPFPQKKDLVQAILTRLRSGQEIAAVTDHCMSPTFVDDFAHALDRLIVKNKTGIYHTVGSEGITPYELAIKIAEIYSLDSSLIHETTREQFFAGRAPRPFNLSLNNDKIEKLGVKMKTVEEGLAELQEQTYHAN